MNKRLCSILFALFVAVGLRAQNDTVSFSASGGFYEDVLQLELFNSNPQNHIRYTTNGDRPTAQSPLYEGPLVLDASKYSKSNIYTIVNCPLQDFYLPDSVQHCIVIRAAVFDENDSCVSTVKTNSYFIHALGCDTHGLPAVSLCADSLDLFDYETGILVPGMYYDPLDPQWSGNYYQEGDDWERPMNVEFYEQDNTGINQQAGLRTHGGNGRRFQQKCLKMYARERYGKKRFKHKFFDNIPLQNFKHLVLKPFASSWNQSGVNDPVCNRIASQLNVEALASRPVVLFLNGEYWGIYYIHERPDERFLEDHFDVDIEHVNIINGCRTIPDCGSATNYFELFNWMEDADLSIPEDYDYAKTKIDIDNFIDYQIFELFSENTDWPANNVRCWQVDDGKWRWFFFDGDACLRWMTFNAFDNAVYEGNDYWPSNWRATLFFRRLMENSEFSTQFHTRFNELLGTALDYSVTGPIYSNIRSAVESEVPYQSERFAYPTSVVSWNEGMAQVNWFLMKRSEYIQTPLDSLVGVVSYDYEPLSCYPNPSTDEIHVYIDSDQPGADDISIYDMLGRKVFTMPCQLSAGMNEIPIHPNLTAGIYVLKIGHSFHKIIRQ